MLNKAKETNTAELPKCYSVAQLCERTGLSRATVSRALNCGDLEHYRMGSRVLIPELAAVAWLERHRIGRLPRLRVA
jgi:excisionase family DNA binding protein